MDPFEGIAAPVLLAGALLITVGVLGDFARRVPFAGRPTAVNGGDFLAGFVALFLAVMISNQGVRALLFPGGIETTGEWLRNEVIRHGPMLAFCGAVVWKLGRLEGDPLGCGRSGLPRDALLGGVLYAVLLLPILAVHEVHRRWVLGGQDPQQSAVDHLASLDSGGLFLFILVVAVITPFYEELLFRGLLARGIQRALVDNRIPGAELVSLIASSALFTVIHPSFTWGPIFFLAMILGFVYLRSGRLWLVVVLHGVHNLTTILFHL